MAVTGFFLPSFFSACHCDAKEAEVVASLSTVEHGRMIHDLSVMYGAFTVFVVLFCCCCCCRWFDFVFFCRSPSAAEFRPLLALAEFA